MYASTIFWMHGLASYEMWPWPLRVMSTELVSCLCTFWAHTYGVAGSPVPPTSRIGGALSAVNGPACPVGGTGQYAHPRFEYWVAGPKCGEACAYEGPNAS